MPEVMDTRPETGLPVSIVIPVYNQVEFTRTCLLALSHHTPGALYELIVVDNASTDGTQALLANVAGSFRVVRNDRNLGFARACNQGARLARGEHVLFLNNDTAPLAGWLEALLRELDAPDVGVVGAKLLYPQTGLVQHAGMAIAVEDTLPVHLFRHMDPRLPPVDESRDFEMVTGACMLIRRALFERLGGFDEGYLNGFEDVDLCLRVREAGYRVRYAPQSVVYHCEGTSEGRFDYNQANYERFKARWQGCFDAAGRLRREVAAEARKVPLAIHAPIFALGACGEEARLLAPNLGGNLAVCDTGPHSAILHRQIGAREAAALESLGSGEIASAKVHLHVGSLEAIVPAPGGYQIARTSFETAHLLPEQVTKCNQMNEIWLPTGAQVAACVRAGVRARLVKIPLGIDTERFKPGLDPLPLPMSGLPIFLGVGEWSARKGWDLLLAAWARAFSSTDRVCLLLRVHPAGHTDNPYLGSEIAIEIERALAMLGVDRGRMAPIAHLPEQLAPAAMPHLYAAAQALVCSARETRWGRSVLEAKACGLPVLALRDGDVESLAESMRRIAGEESNRSRALETPPAHESVLALMRQRLDALVKA
ncbi:MAG TPA: glycosyltransferase [Oscillatoriaceae cyanobacterium]